MPLSSRRLRAWWCGAFVLAPSVLGGCPGHIDDAAPYLAALEGAAGGAGGGGNGVGGGASGQSAAGGGTGGGSGCGDIPGTLLLPSCGPVGCHGGAKPASKLDLASPGVAARLVGKPGFGCGGNLADPASPETSLLYLKIATPVPACGGRMPLGVDPLDAATIACVAAWIGSLQPDGGAP